MKEDFYDKIYQSTPEVFGSDEIKSGSLIGEFASLLPAGAEVLDVGAGQGRQSIPLARAGHHVHAIEYSRVGTDQISEAAKREGLQLVAEQKDVREGIGGQKYDGVISSFVLEHFIREEGVRLIKAIKETTKAGGINAIATFLADGDAWEQVVRSSKDRFYPRTRELSELYSDWEVLDYHEDQATLVSKGENGEQLRNMVVQILARKPKG